MYDTILFDLDGTLAPFQQDEFVHTYFKALVRRLVPMGYDGDTLVQALWKGVDAMIGNGGTLTNRQVFWEVFTGSWASRPWRWRASWETSMPKSSTECGPCSGRTWTGAG